MTIRNELTLAVMLGRLLLFEDELALEVGGGALAHDGAELGQRHAVVRAATPGHLPQVAHLDGERGLVACNQHAAVSVTVKTACLASYAHGNTRH